MDFEYMVLAFSSSGIGFETEGASERSRRVYRQHVNAVLPHVTQADRRRAMTALEINFSPAVFLHVLHDIKGGLSAQVAELRVPQPPQRFPSMCTLVMSHVRFIIQHNQVAISTLPWVPIAVFARRRKMLLVIVRRIE